MYTLTSVWKGRPVIVVAVVVVVTRKDRTGTCLLVSIDIDRCHYEF